MSIKGAELGFEQTLWAAADKLRGHYSCRGCGRLVACLSFSRQSGNPEPFWVFSVTPQLVAFSALVHLAQQRPSCSSLALV